MTQPAVLTRSQVALMVAALVLSVVSFQLNATMLGPAFYDIEHELGKGAFAAMSTYFYLAAAVGNVVLIRWSDYIGRKRVLLGILVMLCLGTLLCIFGTSLTVVVIGRILQGACNVTFGLSFLIMRERLSGATFGVCCGVVTSINGGVAGVDALLGGFLAGPPHPGDDDDERIWECSQHGQQQAADERAGDADDHFRRQAQPRTERHLAREPSHENADSDQHQQCFT